MSEQKKLSDEELVKLKDLEQMYHGLTKEYGELAYQITQIQIRQGDIEQQFRALERERNEYGAFLIDKYGAGTVDINTGLIAPDEVVD